MISQKTVETILATARIEEVVGDFINLKKRGVNFIGLCPFHNEKTPSFTVSPSKDIYKCFGCGRAGNAVTFLMEHEKYTFPQSLIFLANKYHIEVEEIADAEKNKEEQDDLESIYIVLNYAQKFYHDYLLNTEEGQAIGLPYFKERKFDMETILKFNLGLSSSGYDTFSSTAVKEGYKEEFLIEAGLSIRTQDNRLIDRFRDRAMFPIHSISGRVLGFGGRALKQHAEAKYINSPETRVYSKSNVLYGLFQAKASIRKTDFVYMVEGYTDLISLHQAGIENVVASLGTSLTDNHVKLIKRLTNNLTFIYDGDQAGINASYRGIDISLAEGLSIRAVPLPAGEDPDSFAKANSRIEVSEFLSTKAEDFILFKSKLLFENSDRDPIKKAEGIRSIVQSILQIPSPIHRTEYIRQLSRISNVEESALIRELNNQLRNRQKKQTEKQLPEESAPEPVIPPQSTIIGSVAADQEKKLLQLMIEYGDQKYEDVLVANVIIDHIKNTDWEDPSLKSLFEFYLQYFDEHQTYPNFQIFLMHPDEKIRDAAKRIITPSQSLSKNWSQKINQTIPVEMDVLKEIKFCLKHFELRKYFSMKKQNLIELKQQGLTEEKEQEIMLTDKFIQEKINEISKELSVVYY